MIRWRDRQRESKKKGGMVSGVGGVGQDASAYCFEPGDAHKSSSFLSHSLTKRRQKSEMSAVTEK